MLRMENRNGLENGVILKERFVSVPGIIDIRWRSDDPEIFVEPVDLFEEQERGLPELFGKKDRTTTLQPYFTCHPCQCELMSVVTLRAHCTGRKHQKGEMKQKFNYNREKLTRKEFDEAKSLTTDQMAQIISECVDDHVSPVNLAKKYSVRADTIRAWIRKAGKTLPKTYKKPICHTEVVMLEKEGGIVRSRSPIRVSVEEDEENNRKRRKDCNDNKEIVNENKESEVENDVRFREEGIGGRSRSPVRISVEEEDVTRFHHKVGQAVMMVMNQYWPGAQEFTGVRKISSEEEYANTARRLSNEIREKIKEGYKAFNRNTLEGIRFTEDHALIIRTEVESIFEGRPQIS